MLLGIASYFDYRKAKIPNWLTGTGLLLAVAVTIGKVGINSSVYIALLLLLVRTGITTVVLYPFFKIGVLGAGDVKLCAVCAAFLESGDCVPVFVRSLLVAATIGLCKLLLMGNLKERIGYFFSYAADVVLLGICKPYWTKENMHLKKDASLRMAGPLLIGVFWYMCRMGLFL